MTQPKDFEKVIKERLESLGKKPKDPDKPLKGSVRAPDSDEGVDKDKALKRSQKAKKKKLNGYKNRSSKKRGK